MLMKENASRFLSFHMLHQTSTFKFCRGKVWIEGLSSCQPGQNKIAVQDGYFILVGVKGLKPSTSRSQTERAINCATPRCATIDYNVFS